MDDKKFAPAAAASDSTEDTTTPSGQMLRRRTPWDTVEGRVISLISRKGGVGKTTSAVNLGAALALSGHTVLVIGTDPQCGVCRTLGYGPEDLTRSLQDIFEHDRAMNEIAHPSGLSGLFFISPRVTSLDEEESYLKLMADRIDVFTGTVDRARNLYDTILIDCPPNLGAATRAALLASDSFLVPVQAEELCRDSLGNLIDFVGAFRSQNFALAGTPDQDEPLAMEGMFLTMANPHTRMGRHVAEKVGEDFADALFEADIPRTVRLSEMAVKGKPAVIYDRRSPGSRAYFNLADELVQRYCQGRPTVGSTGTTQSVEAELDDATIDQGDASMACADGNRDYDRGHRPGRQPDSFLADLAEGIGPRATDDLAVRRRHRPGAGFPRRSARRGRAQRQQQGLPERLGRTATGPAVTKEEVATTDVQRDLTRRIRSGPAGSSSRSFFPGLPAGSHPWR